MDRAPLTIALIALTVAVTTAQPPPVARVPARNPVNAEHQFSLAEIRDRCIEFTTVKQGTRAGDYRACAVSAFGELGVVDGDTYYYAIYCLIPSYEEKGECGDHSFNADYHSRRGLAVFARRAPSETARLAFEHASIEIGADYVEVPEIIHNGAGTILYLPIVVDGSGHYNASEYYLRGKGTWEPIEAVAWIGDLSKRVPAGLEMWKGIWPDLHTMRAEVGLYGQSDANCCPTGGIAKVRLSIRSRQFVVASVVIEDEPQTGDDGKIVFDVADEWLRRAVEYVARFEQTFGAVIWRERYEQEDRIRRRFGASGATTSNLVARRRLDSELLFVWLANDVSWVVVRDVIALDGTPRPAAERRLDGLLSGPAMSAAQLRQLAARNGRFNIGQIVRTFNEPTLALLFLDDHYRDRFRFRRTGEETIKGQAVATFEFGEVGRPTVIQARDRDVPVRGTLSIDEDGRVWQTSMELSEPTGGLSGRMTVSYGPDPRFDVLVPLEMREAYTSRLGEEVTTVATYSDFRRFETAGRVILPK